MLSCHQPDLIIQPKRFQGECYEKGWSRTRSSASPQPGRRVAESRPYRCWTAACFSTDFSRSTLTSVATVHSASLIDSRTTVNSAWSFGLRSRSNASQKSRSTSPAAMSGGVGLRNQAFRPGPCTEPGNGTGDCKCSDCWGAPCLAPVMISTRERPYEAVKSRISQSWALIEDGTRISSYITQDTGARVPTHCLSSTIGTACQAQ